MNAKIIGVMACDPHGLVGNSKLNHLPWSYPEDTAFYQKLVEYQPLIMGYDTFCKIPGKLLKENTIAVISAHHKTPSDKYHFYSSIESFLNSELYHKTPVFYHLGGAQTMNQFLEKNLIDEFYLTKFKKVYVGDRFINHQLIEKFSGTCLRDNDALNITHYFLKNK